MYTPLISLILLLASGSNGALAQTVSGCTGSPANLAIGGLGKQANALISKALASALSGVSTKVATKLAAINIKYAVSPPVTVAINKDINVTASGNIGISDVVLTDPKEILTVDTITCAPPANRLSTSATVAVKTTVGLTAQSLTAKLSGSVQVSVSSSKPLPAGIPSTPFAVTVSGTFVVDNLTATTDVYLTIKVSGTTKLTYNASVTGFNNTDVGVGSVSYVPAKTPTGPLANITFQVQEAVNQVVIPKIDSLVSKAIQNVLNKNVDKFKHSGTYTIV